MNQPRSVSSEIASTDWQGSLCLEFAYRNGTTQLIHNQGRAPLKVQRPFYPEGNEVCHGVILHTAGGLVGGDRLSVDLCLRAQANVLLTTPAASRVYRTNGKAAQQIIQINLESGACLEWLPQETIVFNQAVYSQQMRVNLEPGACWVGWEITRFGRSARGERFVAGDWRSHTEIWQNDRPVWIDRQWLPASEELCTSPYGLANCSVVASFALVGRSLDAMWVEKARSLWMGHPDAAGVTRLMSGLLCRYRGHSTMEARRWFVEVWRLVRGLYGSAAEQGEENRPLCIPRVWQL